MKDLPFSQTFTDTESSKNNINRQVVSLSSLNADRQWGHGVKFLTATHVLSPWPWWKKLSSCLMEKNRSKLCQKEVEEDETDDAFVQGPRWTLTSQEIGTRIGRIRMCCVMWNLILTPENGGWEMAEVQNTGCAVSSPLSLFWQTIHYLDFSWGRLWEMEKNKKLNLGIEKKKS